MNEDRLKQLRLGALAAVLIAVLAYQLLPALSFTSSGENVAGGGLSSRVTGEGALETEIEDLDLDLLTSGPGQFTPGRDPFNFGAPPPPPPPPPPSQEDVEQQDRLRRAMEAARVVEDSREPVAASPPAPQPPPIDLVYLGSFGTAAKRLAVFSDGADIYNALVGSVIKDKFVVVQVGLESVDLGFVGFPDVPAERLGAGE